MSGCEQACRSCVVSGDVHHSRSVESNRRMLLCRIWFTMRVLRVDPKWAVAKSDFPDDVYPPYCSGIALVMSLDVALVLSRIASRVAYFWVDDVFLTGLLPARYTSNYIHVAGSAIHFNHLERKSNYSTTSSVMKLVHWPLMGKLLHLIQRRGDWAGSQPAQPPPPCTKCNSPPINGRCINHSIAV